VAAPAASRSRDSRGHAVTKAARTWSVNWVLSTTPPGGTLGRVSSARRWQIGGLGGVTAWRTSLGGLDPGARAGALFAHGVVPPLKGHPGGSDASALDCHG